MILSNYDLKIILGDINRQLKDSKKEFYKLNVLELLEEVTGFL